MIFEVGAIVVFAAGATMLFVAGVLEVSIGRDRKSVV